MDVSVERKVAAIVDQVVKELVQSRSHTKRKPLIVANWKMNMMINDAVQFFENLSLDDNARTVVCPPYPLLYPMNILTQKLKSKRH